MIFGFNTDVKHGSTVYHVQSEARERELILQTQVFLSGRCVAKCATSFAEDHAQAEFSSDVMHDLLRAQHRNVLDLVRNGHVEEVSSSTGREGAPRGQSLGHRDGAHEPLAESNRRNEVCASDATADPAPLNLAWLNSAAFDDCAAGTLQLQFLVAEAGAGVSDARVIVKLNGSAGVAQYGQSITGTDGRALVPIAFNAADHGELVALLVQATAQGRSVTRKFHLRRGNA